TRYALAATRGGPAGAELAGRSAAAEIAAIASFTPRTLANADALADEERRRPHARIQLLELRDGDAGARGDRGERVAGAHDRVLPPAGGRAPALAGGRDHVPRHRPGLTQRRTPVVQAGANEQDRDRHPQQERCGCDEARPVPAPRARHLLDLPARDGPDVALEPCGFGAGGGSEVAAVVAERVDHRARRRHERARRAARERARDVGRRRPLRADAGQQKDRLRHQLPRFADRARVGGADDRADARQPALADEVLAPLGDEPRDLLPQRPPVREDEILDLDARVRRLDEAEEAAAAPATGGEEGLERLAAEVGAHGERVGERLAVG